MKNRTAQKKGNAFEEYLIGVMKEELDKEAKSTYQSGRGLDKQDVILPNFGIEIEAKNQKTIKIIDWWEQCKIQEYGNTGVLIFRNPRKPEFQESLVVMGMEDWIELVKNQNEVVEVETNFKPELRWKIKRLLEATKAVEKELKK